MDQDVLVKNGHSLIKALDEKGIQVKAAVWIHNADINSWKLWIVTQNVFEDKRAFYRKVSEIIAKKDDFMWNIDASDTELVGEKNPAIAGLARFMKVKGDSSVRMSNNRLNNFYLADGIILRMDL